MAKPEVRRRGGDNFGRGSVRKYMTEEKIISNEVFGIQAKIKLFDIA